MRIAVTGHKGFIGGHVLAAARDHDVWGLDRAGDPGVRLEEMRADAFSGEGVEAVIHLAAHADVRNNWDNLFTLNRDNIEATYRTLEAVRRCGTVKTFVFISTGAVYAGHEGGVTPDTVPIATSPYAATKLAGEAYVQAWAEKCEFRWFVLRPAACFGGGYHHGHIADFVRQMRLNGKIHALDDGRTARPGLHARDLAETCVKLVAEPDYPGGVYNLSSGLWGWRDTIEIMRRIGGGKAVPVTHEDRPSGWLGDGQGAHWTSQRLGRLGIEMLHDVEDGVRDALVGLGWGK
jgi:nucleoside-diphosphate-sugar epimerase